jgi:transposase
VIAIFERSALYISRGSGITGAWDDAPSPRSKSESVPELEQARREIERLQRELERVERERDRLRQHNERLKHQLDAARRAGFRQAAPFAKPLTKHPKRAGRRAGRAYGPKAHRRIPPRVDETYDARLPARCPGCSGAVVEMRIASQYQEELPVPQGHRPSLSCARGPVPHVWSPRPRSASTADVGRPGRGGGATRARSHRGGCCLNKQLGLSFGKVATLFRQQYGLTVTCSGLVHAVHRAARQAQPTYDTLCDAVRGSPVVTPDETGWKVAGTLQWLWTVATPDTTVYAIQPGRGFPEAATLLGEDFAGVMVRDGWAPYRRFTHAVHQTCLAHLLRRCRLLQADHPRAGFVRAVSTLLQQALTVRDRYHAGHMTAHGLAVARGHLEHRMNRRLDQPGSVTDVQRFAAHLALEFPALFTFLLDPTAIDATNWRAEQALRPAVVTRKVCGGNRSWHGAAAQQILASVLRTAHQRHLDVHALVVSMLRAPPPTVPLEFSGRTP